MFVLSCIYPLWHIFNMASNMKTISLTVDFDDYEAFRASAKERGGSIALLIREAMRLYREQRLGPAKRLEVLPVLLGHRPLASLPDRELLYDEIYAHDAQSESMPPVSRREDRK